MGEERSKRYVELCHVTDTTITVRVLYTSNNFIVPKATRNKNLKNMEYLLYTFGENLYVRKEKLEEFKGLLTLNNLQIKEIYL